MQLWEQGKFRMSDPVAKYLPEFAQNGKQEITIRQLLVHYSGLPEDLDLVKKWEGKDAAYRMAFEVAPDTLHGSAFIYSDINFIVLGALVERLSGNRSTTMRRSTFCQPLGMKETRFLPPPSWAPALPYRRDENHHLLRGGRARSHGAPDGRRGGTCGGIFHGRRSGDCLRRLCLMADGEC